MQSVMRLMGVLLVALQFGGKPASAQTVVSTVVRGDCNPYLAGMPHGTTFEGDSAPAQSPVQVLGLSLIAGNRLQFDATGLASYVGSLPMAGPEGYTDSSSVAHAATNGISAISAPATALLGVFLTDNQPNLAPAPIGYSFSFEPSRNYASLSPVVQKLFFIGDGRASGGGVQEIIVPAGATRLFLGTMDGTGWHNNPGSFNVTVREFGATGDASAVPEPSSALLFLPALGVVMLARKKRAA